MSGVTYTGFTAARTWRFAGRWDRFMFVWFAAATVLSLVLTQWALASAWFLITCLLAEQAHDRFKIRALEHVVTTLAKADTYIEVTG